MRLKLKRIIDVLIEEQTQENDGCENAGMLHFSESVFFRSNISLLPDVMVIL